jgi:Tfp pilus assembly protein PilP
MMPKETKPADSRASSGSLRDQRQEMLTSVPLAELKLIGIMWSPDDPRAMVQLPNSRVVIIRPRNKIGLELALVASIREGEVLVILPNLEGSYEQGEVVSIKLRQ